MMALLSLPGMPGCLPLDSNVDSDAGTVGPSKGLRDAATCEEGACRICSFLPQRKDYPISRAGANLQVSRVHHKRELSICRSLVFSPSLPFISLCTARIYSHLAIELFFIITRRLQFGSISSSPWLGQ